MPNVPPKKGSPVQTPAAAKAATRPAAPPAKPSTAVVKRDLGALAVSDVDDDLMGMVAADASKGHGYTADDLLTPFLRIAQALSPEINKQDEKHIKGCEVGMLIDTQSRECFPAIAEEGAEGLVVVPVYHELTHVRFKPRNKGGGLVKDYGTNTAVLNEAPYDENVGKRLFDNGDELTHGHKYFILRVDPNEGTTKKMVLLMVGSQRKKAKKWNSLIASLQLPIPGGDGKQTFNPAKYYAAYSLQTQYEDNDQGNWYGFIDPKPITATLNLPNGRAIYKEARDFEALIESGQVRTQQVPNEEIVTEVEVVAGDPDDNV